MGTPRRGRNQLIVKSDEEPAIVAVREALARCHGGDVTPEQPPPGEHQGNGLAEVSGRHITDQARVMKLHLQHKIDRQVVAGPVGRHGHVPLQERKEGWDDPAPPPERSQMRVGSGTLR